MLSKSTIKLVNSLRVKKYRNEKGLFIAEGERLVEDILNSVLKVESIYHTFDWESKLKKMIPNKFDVTADEMKKISGLSSPSKVLALVSIPDYNAVEIDFSNTLSLALDGIQDPGNMGTIIRLADWFGIDSILCSNETVDVYSPKVVQSCMGAISRVKVIYCNLIEVLVDLKRNNNLPIFGTFMVGNNIYSDILSSKGIIVMGNEGNGISPEVEKLITNRIHIPSFAANRSTVESLNVAMATSIVCSEFRRREYV
ncbi:MAG: RNA methyltransferase [Bacteroidales bacterium]|nr:RNA methyltransferase [Bacteroidales bacterium]